MMRADKLSLSCLVYLYSFSGGWEKDGGVM